MCRNFKHENVICLFVFAEFSRREKKDVKDNLLIFLQIAWLYAVIFFIIGIYEVIKFFFDKNYFAKFAKL